MFLLIHDLGGYMNKVILTLNSIMFLLILRSDGSLVAEKIL